MIRKSLSCVPFDTQAKVSVLSAHGSLRIASASRWLDACAAPAIARSARTRSEPAIRRRGESRIRFSFVPYCVLFFLEVLTSTRLVRGWTYGIQRDAANRCHAPFVIRPRSVARSVNWFAASDRGAKRPRVARKRLDIRLGVVVHYIT